MAVTTRVLARTDPSHESTGRRLPRRRSGLDRLLGSVVGFGRMLEVIAEIERVSPDRRAEVARAWLRELR